MNKIFFKTSLFIILIIILNFSVYSQTLTVGDRVDKGLISNNSLNEISGIAASQINKNIFWIHNDSGNINYIYAINDNAELVETFELGGIKNRDWEDIAVAPGPKGRSYIYVADIGDNNVKNLNKYIYRFTEPLILGKDKNKNRIIKKIDKITFQFPDGVRDAETIMVDQIKKDIYIISKEENKAHVYLLEFPQLTKKILIPTFLGKLNVSKIVGGDISGNGEMVIIKNYTKVFLWIKGKNELLKDVFKREPHTLPYMLEPQGESICWDVYGTGYYTISEKKFRIKPHLYYYPIIEK